MNKKILLMYISEHSGHHQASIALEKAILRKAPDTEILNINAFKYANPALEKLIHSLYMNVIKNQPGIWAYLYDNQKFIARTKRIRDFVNESNSRKFDKLVGGFKPDIAACTQAFPCGIFSVYKKKHNIAAPLVGILTDYAPHSYWLYDNVSAYIVPSDDVGRTLADKGAAQSKIMPLGVPIDPSFAAHPEKEGILAKLNLSARTPIVLVMGGTHGIGPGEKLIRYLSALKRGIQIVVITGLNKQLLRKAERIAARSKNGICALGFVNNVDEIMEIADVIITKPGGLTAAEALAKALPMIIVNPLPGQESFNAKALVSGGMAAAASGDADAVRLLDDLLGSPETLQKMRAAMKANAKPRASEDAAELLLNLHG